MTAVEEKLLNETETKLKSQNWLGGVKPSAADKVACEGFKNIMPNPASHPNAFNWLSLVTKFTPAVQAKWAVVKDEDDIDMFGSDDEDDEASFDALCKAK